jgi:regulator of replication initiation timing
MTDIEKLEKRVKTLDKQVKDLQENLKTLGVANNLLAGKHHALLECVVFSIMNSDQVKTSTTLSSTDVYDRIDEALDSQALDETYKKGVLQDTNVFFERLLDYKNRL